jgi:hypothetical protein
VLLIASDARPRLTSGLGVESCNLSSTEESLAVTEAALLEGSVLDTVADGVKNTGGFAGMVRGNGQVWEELVMSFHCGTVGLRNLFHASLC